MLTTTEPFDTLLVTTALQASAGVAGPLHTAKIILYTNVIAPSKTRVLADLTIAAYAGYAAATPTWEAAFRDSNGNIATQTASMTFQGSGVGLPATITGYGITDSTGATLYAMENFAAPYALNDALSALNFTVEWIANNPNNAGGATILP